MLRPILLVLSVLTLPGVAGPTAADPFRMTTAFSVERPRERPAEPSLKGRVEGAAGRFYGGFRGRTVPRAEHSAAFDLYVGLRPRFGTLDIDLAYSRHMTDASGACRGVFALRLNREIGAQAEVGAGLQMEPDGDAGRAEAHAEISVFERTRLEGRLEHRFRANADDPALTLDLGASRTLGTNASLDLRYRDASYQVGRAELSVRVRF